jgi:hypothetical protein
MTLRPRSEDREERGEAVKIRTQTNYDDTHNNASVSRIADGLQRCGSNRPEGIPEVECYESVDQEAGNKVRSSLKTPRGTKGGYKRRGGY